MSDFPDDLPRVNGFEILRDIRRKLLPRRPGRDEGLEQSCSIYRRSEGDTHPKLLVLTPCLPPDSKLPYYHPQVSHLAFCYISSSNISAPLLRIEAIPLPSTPLDLTSRLYRTSLALLDALHRYGWGAMTNYQKRVLHDCLVPRAEYQDLYLRMRERYRGMVGEWRESTDPLKHVFEVRVF